VSSKLKTENRQLKTAFADIAMATSVREVFTYSVPEALADGLVPGLRVHVPVGSRFAIGVVVRIHSDEPGFKTKPIRSVLDTEPVLDSHMLSLTEWVSRDTFSSWGETIQAALPVGLNYMSEKRIRTVPHLFPSPKGADILNDVDLAGSMSLEEAEKRWGDKMIQKLVTGDFLEIIEEPKTSIKSESDWMTDWSADGRRLLNELIEEPPKRNPAWFKLAPVLLDMELPMPMNRLLDEAGAKEHQIRKWIDIGILESRKVLRTVSEPDRRIYPERMHALNEEQQEACAPILEAFTKPAKPFILFGVTGSGKTEVYIQALHTCFVARKSGIVLVPEIALTPQTVQRFKRVFGDNIAVMHSRLTDRERYNTWMDIRSGRKTIVIGARSAVFAPVQNLGLIIIDEEHDSSYRQEDPAPRYDARDVAMHRAEMSGAVTVLGSATPSLTTLHATAKGQMTLLRLKGRHADAALPQVTVVDLRLYKHAMRGSLAVPVHTAMEEALSRGEQAIVLFNRRGYARFMMCTSCGATCDCPNCSVTLTYHRTSDSLRCHYCGYSERVPRVCGSCAQATIEEQGSGTQKVEEELEAHFPNARILRMDRDTTSRRDSHASILNAFGKGEADILVGTQLVSKGLDFPNVTVVAVVHSDTELAFPSYKSAERMFQLLTQVAGRSGRAEKPGVVFLQTYKPDHPSIIHAMHHDFESFAREEMRLRKSLLWPPYSRLITFEFKDKDSQRVTDVAQAFATVLHQESGEMPVLGPAPSAIHRMMHEYRWELLVKSDPMWSTVAREEWLNRIFRAYAMVRPPGGTSVRINVK
jgi:primosomal protein N' (replication factor Y)